MPVIPKIRVSNIYHKTYKKFLIFKGNSLHLKKKKVESYPNKFIFNIEERVPIAIIFWKHSFISTIIFLQSCSEIFSYFLS